MVVTLCVFLTALNFNTVFADYDIEIKKIDFDDGMCNRRSVFGGWNYSPILGECDKFFQCDEDGVPYLQSCAAGTFYNGEECKHADEVDCKYDLCRLKPDGFQYSDGQSCYGYYLCIHGRSKYMSCPNSFFYKAFKGTCLPDPTCNKDNLVHPCSFGTTYPVPGRPDRFYLYDGHSKMTAMKCPRGLWYRPDLCTCDWITPGKVIGGKKCSPMFHFSYDGNFLEKNNRVQQVVTENVGIYMKSALFNEGGKILILAMNNVDLDSDFLLSFEFLTKTFTDEVALISNDNPKGYGATYKITFVPSQGILKAYVVLKDDHLIKLEIIGVNPEHVNKVLFGRKNEKMILRVNNMPPAIVPCDDGLARNKNPMVIGQAGGCVGFQGFIDEVKFYRCIPKGVLDDVLVLRDHDDSDEILGK